MDVRKNSQKPLISQTYVVNSRQSPNKGLSKPPGMHYMSEKNMCDKSAKTINTNSTLEKKLRRNETSDIYGQPTADILDKIGPADYNLEQILGNRSVT